jgi:hypothetical protein
MAAGDLYREIEDHEFQGENFFYAKFTANEMWVDATPPDFKVRYASGERLILEKLDDEWYQMIGVYNGRLNKWGVSSAVYYGTHSYRVHKDWLGDICPRLIGGE